MGTIAVIYFLAWTWLWTQLSRDDVDVLREVDTVKIKLADPSHGRLWCSAVLDLLPLLRLPLLKLLFEDSLLLRRHHLYLLRFWCPAPAHQLLHEVLILHPILSRTCLFLSELMLIP